MRPTKQFTFSEIERQLSTARELGYEFLTCREYLRRRASSTLPEKTLVLRVDIDGSCKKSKRLAEILGRIGVSGSFFVRLHAPEYNPFAFENYLCLKYIRDQGHEIGYHSEIVDQATIWNEDASECLRRDIEVLNAMLRIEIVGVASHGGMTGLNNLDFWADRKASEFGLLYEAYDKSSAFGLFEEAFYISDSEWTQWKCYDKGKLVAGDRRDLAEHLADGHSLVYLLIHGDTYFDNHFYE